MGLYNVKSTARTIALGRDHFLPWSEKLIKSLPQNAPLLEQGGSSKYCLELGKNCLTGQVQGKPGLGPEKRWAFFVQAHGTRLLKRLTAF